MPMNRIPVAAGLFFAALALGCAQNIVQERGGSATASITARRVVVIPFTARQRGSGPAIRPDAAALVSSYVAESFEAGGIDTVPASDVQQAFGDTPSDVSVVQMARDRFGADVVVMGNVHRWRERGGQAMGTLSPASVGFEVKAYTAADGKLFRGLIFDHTQVALGENALTAAQYPGGGTRWLTAEELARWGASRVVQTLPITAP
jgi:nucleotide-binding universal stress UspA family protein